MRTVNFKAGETIFLQGYPGDYAYVVIHGQVEIYLEQIDKSEQQLALLGEGALFGEMALMDDAPRSASARAVTDCTLQIMEM
jgi:CRP-like cAMP-binding protein